MGVNLVEDKDTPKLTYGEIFDKYFPLYLSYGMNYEQFWNDRVELAKAYRESHKLEMKRKNEELWLNGVYQMEALKSTIGNMFLKKGSKPHQYPKEPLPITQEEIKAKQLAEEEAKIEAMKQRLMSKMR
jgi:hypothetical protein